LRYLRAWISSSPFQLAQAGSRSILDGLKHYVSHGGGGLAVGLASLPKAKLRECIFQLDVRGGIGGLLAEPAGQHSMFVIRK
jgi:hypothetical protein